MQPIFITGIGTGIGKTVISAIVAEALEADFWKPVQAGFAEGTDTITVSKLLVNKKTKLHDEVYKLKLPASPHIAARNEHVKIDLDVIKNAFDAMDVAAANDFVIIEGAGGLMVPLNRDEFILDLIKKLHAKVILVSRNYLGSINHSLLISQACKAANIKVIGWLFNDQFMDYEEDIVQWSGFKKIASVPHEENINAAFVKEQAGLIKPGLLSLL